LAEEPSTLAAIAAVTSQPLGLFDRNKKSTLKISLKKDDEVEKGESCCRGKLM
jgi:hypothetical protein